MMPGMQQPRIIGVCVIGAGRAGLIHARNFASAVPSARLVALADPIPEAAAKAGQELSIPQTFSDYRKALEASGVDAVVIATPTAHHREIVVAAAAAGKHVFCEKPMAMNEADCDAMIEATRSAGVLLQIGFMRRFDAGFLDAKERVQRGEIGEVVLVKSVTRGPSVPQRWQYDLARSNGTLAEVNSHDIDTLRWFSGSEFRDVYAIAGNYRCPDAKSEFPDFYDNLVMTCRFENGVQGNIDGAASVKYGYDCRVEILGTQGVIFVGRQEETSVRVCASDRSMRQAFVPSWRDLFRPAYLAEDVDFADSIRSGRVPRVGGLDGKMAVRVVNAGNRSIRERRPVVVGSISG